MKFKPIVQHVRCARRHGAGCSALPVPCGSFRRPLAAACLAAACLARLVWPGLSGPACLAWAALSKVTAEENRPRWGVRTSNPGRVARRLLVGSTPASSAN